jgi:hypothetical protein
MMDAATADRYTLKEIEGMVEIAWAKFNANRAKK